MNHRRSVLRGGFTAVEMAVVMGVIMLLVGMTIPALSSSLRKGRLNSAVGTAIRLHQQAVTAARAYPGRSGGLAVSTTSGADLAITATDMTLAANSTTNTVVLNGSIKVTSAPQTLSYERGTGFVSAPNPRTIQISTLDGQLITSILIYKHGIISTSSNF